MGFNYPKNLILYFKDWMPDPCQMHVKAIASITALVQVRAISCIRAWMK